MLIKDVDTPSADTGVVPVICVVEAEAAPAMKVTVPPAFATGVTIESVLTCALVDFKVHVDEPRASVTEQAV